MTKEFKDQLRVEFLKNLPETNLVLKDIIWRWKVLNEGISKSQYAEYSIEFPFFIGYHPLNVVSSSEFNTSESLITRLDEVEYDPKMFIPISINPILDKFFSNKGGVMPATITMIVGDPGIGKNTVWMDALSEVQLNQPDKRVLFISAEMDEIDLFEYKERFPSISNMDIFFIGNFIENDPRKKLEDLLNEGYDIVLTDSFSEVQEIIKSEYNISNKQAESWLLNKMLLNKAGKNKRSCYTAFLNIVQVNKGGNFLGSNKLKHNTTAMLDMRYDGDDRYMEFVKNRRGLVNQRLYFTIRQNSVVYDHKRLESATRAIEQIKQNTVDSETRREHFDHIFGTQAVEIE